MNNAKENAILLAGAGKCEGSCEQHTGVVRVVHVTHGKIDWSYFAYCDEARAEDERRGMRVTLAESEAQP